MDSVTLLIFQLIVFIFSVMIHEVSHGYVAERLGDSTARLEGRLTLNPLKHLDPFGSIFLPISLYFLTSGGFVFGWAKPVPYNPNNLKDPRGGAAKIAAAGPISNFLIAIIFGILFRVFVGSGGFAILSLFAIIIYINILLAVFNLVPLPPLDGSKILYALLPTTESGERIRFFLERYGLILLLFFIFFGFDVIVPIIHNLFRVVTGVVF